MAVGDLDWRTGNVTIDASLRKAIHEQPNEHGSYGIRELLKKRADKLDAMRKTEKLQQIAKKYGYNFTWQPEEARNKPLRSSFKKAEEEFRKASKHTSTWLVKTGKRQFS